MNYYHYYHYYCYCLLTNYYYYYQKISEIMPYECIQKKYLCM